MIWLFALIELEKKTDKFLNTIYKSNIKNGYVKSDTLDLSDNPLV